MTCRRINATISVNIFLVAKMAIFGIDNKADSRIDKLMAQLRESESARKKLSADLAAANQKITELENLLLMAKAKEEESRRRLIKARQRQKNSVERANRFKAKLGKSASLLRS